MRACDVTNCGREATVLVRFPHSGSWPYCGFHGRVWSQYATRIRRPA